MSNSVRGSNAIVVMGVSGCGKTTVGQRLAEVIDARFIEGDTLHPATNVEKMRTGTPLQDEDRLPWLDLIGFVMADALGGGESVVASCSALKRAYRDRLRAAIGPRLRFVFLNASREELSGRMRMRGVHFMPEALLDSQLQTLEPPVDEPDIFTPQVHETVDDIIGELLSTSMMISDKSGVNRK